ncbi:MAG TPA: Fe-Mn family superoxide dismutase [Nitrospiraceae bacterium]|jgi:superoxide dismutase, Fe-Mn family|nr:Fe-Mn family superoxide dismutase [Nitrospiraceae bacterium]
MKMEGSYNVKPFELNGLNGISDRTLEMHIKLYEGYVKAANQLTTQIGEMLKDGRIDHEEMPAYSELTRRLGFEYNGMVLHEYYFENLHKGRAKKPDQGSAFVKAAEDSFGTYDMWKLDFSSVGMLRGVGWAVCSLNPASGRLSNYWISLHEHGHMAGFIPILVMDVWEHAYLLDYKPAERASYIEAFFSNIDWKSVESRLQLCEPALAEAARG